MLRREQIHVELTPSKGCVHMDFQFSTWGDGRDAQPLHVPYLGTSSWSKRGQVYKAKYGIVCRWKAAALLAFSCALLLSTKCLWWTYWIYLTYKKHTLNLCPCLSFLRGLPLHPLGLQIDISHKSNGLLCSNLCMFKSPRLLPASDKDLLVVFSFSFLMVCDLLPTLGSF